MTAPEVSAAPEASTPSEASAVPEASITELQYERRSTAPDVSTPARCLHLQVVPVGLLTGGREDHQPPEWRPTDHAWYGERARDVFDDLPKWCAPLMSAVC